MKNILILCSLLSLAPIIAQEEPAKTFSAKEIKDCLDRSRSAANAKKTNVARTQNSNDDDNVTVENLDEMVTTAQELTGEKLKLQAQINIQKQLIQKALIPNFAASKGVSMAMAPEMKAIEIKRLRKILADNNTITDPEEVENYIQATTHVLELSHEVKALNCIHEALEETLNSVARSSTPKAAPAAPASQSSNN